MASRYLIKNEGHTIMCKELRPYMVLVVTKECHHSEVEQETGPSELQVREAHARLPCNLRSGTGMPGLRGLRWKSNAVEPDVEIPRLRIRADGDAIDKRVGTDRRPIAEVSGSFHNYYAAIRTCDLKLELALGSIKC